MFLSWSPLDQDKALAYERQMRTVCKCGTRAIEWEENPNAYIGDFWVCEGCARLEMEADNVPEGTKGVHFRLLPEEQAVAKAATMGDHQPTAVGEGGEEE